MFKKLNTTEKSSSGETNSSSPIQEIPPIHRKFTAAFTAAQYLSLSWARLTQSTSPSHVLKIHFNIILAFTPRSSSGPFLPTKTMYSPLPSHKRATCHAHLILYLIIRLIFGEKYTS
jgi:hypothetical protein